MNMQSKSLRKVLSWCLTLCLVISLMPVIPASAESWKDNELFEVTTTYKTVEEALADGFSGLAYEYSEGKGSGSNASKDVISVKVYAVNLALFEGFASLIHYDTTVLQRCRTTGNSSATVAQAITFPTLDSLNVLSEEGLNASWENDSEVTVFLKNETSISSGDEGNLIGMWEENVPRSDTNGNMLIDYGTKTAIANSTDFSIAPVSLYNCLNDRKWEFENKSVHLFTVSLQPKADKTLDDVTFETIGLWSDTTNADYKYGSIAGTKNGKVMNAAFIGFPGSEELNTPTAKVTVKVQATDSNTTPLVGATVTINGETYTSKDDGTLPNVLNLGEGTYNWTVDPGTSATLASHSGSFSIGTSDLNNEKTVTIYAKSASAATEQYYDLTLYDGQMTNTPLKADTPVQVSINNGEAKEYKVSEGQISIARVPGGNAVPMTISAKGYETVSWDNVAFTSEGIMVNDSGARANTKLESVTMDQQKINVTLSVPAGTTGPTYVVIEKKGVVTDKMDLTLPITLEVTDGKVSQALPDGEYMYTVKAPGAENVTMNLTVYNTGLQGEFDGETAGVSKVTISDPADPMNKKVELTPVGGAVTANNSATMKAEVENDEETDAAVTLPQIDDRMYSAVGTWNNDGMTVDIYLKNTKSNLGVFGMQVDTNVFNGNNITVAYTDNTRWFNGSVADMTNDPDLSLGAATLTNPLVKNGQVLFVWTGRQNQPVDATNGLVKIATVTLRWANDVNSTNFKPLVTSNTLQSLDFKTTDWYSTIQGAGLGTKEAEFIAKYWRPVDAQNDNVAAYPDRLEKSKAGPHNAFYQTYDATAESAVPQDTMQQFIFETFSNSTTLKFVVTEPGTPDPTAVPGATVTVKGPDGTVIGTGTTGDDGIANITVPAGTGDVTYEVTKPGYVTESGTVAEADQKNDIEVTLNRSTEFDVKIHDDQKTEVKLVGGKAYNGADYYFTLETLPGYTWKDGTMPAGSELTIRMTATGTSGEFTSSTQPLDATWDGTLNKYKIDKNAMNFSETSGVIVVRVADGKIEQETDPTQAFTVTVVSGKDGNVAYAEPASGTGVTITNNADGTTNGGAAPFENVTITEQLTPNGTSSAKYTFKGNGPLDGEADKKEAEQPYYAYVINTMTVNGADQPLSDYEKINGVNDYQINGIAGNQVIDVTYGKALVEGNTIKDGPDPDPDTDSTVTVILSDYGQADVKQPKVETWDGADTKTYTVAPGTPFEALFNAKAEVAQPDGEAVSYEIDTVTLDGVQVNTGSDSRWTNGSASTGGTTGGYQNGTLKFTATAGKNYTVVVTFKPIDKDPIFAQLEVVNNTGNISGGTVPTGLKLVTIGLPETVTMTPATNWTLGAVELTEPGASLVDETAKATLSGSDYVYQTPALKAGATVVGVTFKKDVADYSVKLVVHYAAIPGNSNVTAVNITFTEQDGSQIVYGPDKADAYKLDNPTGQDMEYTVKIPAGTYSVAVSKNGYLTYTVSDFVIANDGTTTTAGSTGTMDTKVDSGIIYFGQTNTDAAQRKIMLTLGDATWDGNLIALDDIAQVANGLTVGATAGQKKRADLDETNSVVAADMGYVINAYGNRSTNETYTAFMAKTN